MARKPQKHFVGYHNQEKMAAERDDDTDESSNRHWGFLTKKSTDSIVGGVIWWITGEGVRRGAIADDASAG